MRTCKTCGLEASVCLQATMADAKRHLSGDCYARWAHTGKAARGQTMTPVLTALTHNITRTIRRLQAARHQGDANLSNGRDAVVLVLEAINAGVVSRADMRKLRAALLSDARKAKQGA